MIDPRRQSLLLNLMLEFADRELWFGETSAQEVAYIFQELGGGALYEFIWDGWMPTCQELVDDLYELRARQLARFEPWTGVRGPSLQCTGLSARKLRGGHSGEPCVVGTTS